MAFEHEALVVHPPKAVDIRVEETGHDLGLTGILEVEHRQLHPPAIDGHRAGKVRPPGESAGRSSRGGRKKSSTGTFAWHLGWLLGPATSARAADTNTRARPPSASRVRAREPRNNDRVMACTSGAVGGLTTTLPRCALCADSGNSSARISSSPVEYAEPCARCRRHFASKEPCHERHDHEIRLSGIACCTNTGAGSCCCGPRSPRSAVSCSPARKRRRRSAPFRQRRSPSSPPPPRTSSVCCARRSTSRRSTIWR